MSFPSATYDPDADVLYIALRTGDQARAVELDDSHFIDIDEHGRVLGIEVLYPRMGIELDVIAAHTGIPALELVRVVHDALSDAGIFMVPTVTAQSPVQHGYSIVHTGSPQTHTVTTMTGMSGVTLDRRPQRTTHEFSLTA